MAGRETPATGAARRGGVRFALREYAHDPATERYGLEAAEALGVDPERVYKTLLARLAHAAVLVSAGRRGLELELAPGDLLRLTGGRTAPIAR